MKVEVYIEGQRLDLYEDENITIQSNAQNINDISKVYSDFSQTFTVPASDNNNQIFKYYYNADINNGYDARTRKQAVIYVDTKDFKRGKMRLDGASLKHGVAENYKITFFGDVIRLKDDIGDDRLFDLDWLSNFDHLYSDTNIKIGLTTGLDFTVDSVLYEAAIIYPLISYQRQYLYNSDASDTTSTEELVNINYNASRSDGIDFSELKPAIKLELIIQAIEEKYGFNFTGSFFSSDRFKDIYMNLNKTTDSLANGFIEFENENVNYTTTRQISWQIGVVPNSGFESIPYQVKAYINDNPVWESNNGTGNKSVSLLKYLDIGDTNFRIEVITESSFSFDATSLLRSRETGAGALLPFGVDYNNIYTSESITLETKILNELQDIKVLDFLTSLIKMFNLVVRPDGTDIKIQDLQTWYTEGEIYDITPYVDTRTEKIKRGEIYRELNWNFEESDQILSDEFRKNNKAGYGDLEFALVDESGDPIQDIDGGSLDIDVLFENPIYERLFDLNDNTITDVQYCLYLNRDLKSISGNPFLFYADNSKNVSLGFKNSTGYEELTSVFMPTHSRQIDGESFNLNFNAEVNEYTGEVYGDTIFNRYYEDYITDMFSIRRRIYNYESILPNSILNKLDLNARFIIKDRRYIINNISSNIVNRKDSLELINDIYDAPLASDVLNTSKFSPYIELFTGDAQNDSTTYIGKTGKTIQLVDTGDGTSWITLNNTITTSVVYEVGFSLDTNLTGNSRTAQIQVLDSVNDPKYTIVQDNKLNAALVFNNSQNSVYPSIILNVKS